MRHSTTHCSLVIKVVVFGSAAVGLWVVSYRAVAVVFVAVLVADLLAIRFGHLTL